MPKKNKMLPISSIKYAGENVQMSVSLARFEKQFQEAQFYLDSIVMTDMVPYMPMQTGSFIAETRGESAALAGSGLVVAAVPPMGRFLYEGKGMVDELTGSAYARKGAKKVKVSQYTGKTNAKENLTYSRHANKKARAHWFDTAKKSRKNVWVSTVKNIAGGG